MSVIVNCRGKETMDTGNNIIILDEVKYKTLSGIDLLFFEEVKVFDNIFTANTWAIIGTILFSLFLKMV
ncbi:hypothetical protein [Bathymodiolus thermophilus thioautotrophic gill symbiont]|jgi:hypothetical protein|nr:hypothetical protein [Bathymodiolus thermophilus thioautotrophic gill symbiont]